MSENEKKVTYSVKPKITYTVAKFVEDGKAFSISGICEVEREEQANAIIAALQAAESK